MYMRCTKKINFGKVKRILLSLRQDISKENTTPTFLKRHRINEHYTIFIPLVTERKVP